MKRQIRGATNLALIATLAISLGISGFALAAAARTPTQDGDWIETVCKTNPNGRTRAECVADKCWDLWHDQGTPDAYTQCFNAGMTDGPG